MPRLKLSAQGIYPFRTVIELLEADMNHAAHMGFDRILCVTQRAWSVLFAELGVTDTDLGDGATGIIVSDVAINFRAEAFAGQRLGVELRPLEIDVSTFRFAVRVSFEDSGEPVALLEVGMVAFDYRTRVKGRLPPDVAAGLRALAR